MRQGGDRRLLVAQHELGLPQFEVEIPLLLRRCVVRKGLNLGTQADGVAVAYIAVLTDRAVKNVFERREHSAVPRRKSGSFL